jgi:KDO2-lipid IV(A) lauroyltransferase
LLYYVFKYRRDVVLKNLDIVFPEKPAEEKVKIAKEFYKGLVDSFIETIKFFSLSDKSFSERLTGNFEIFQQLYPTGQSIQLHGGHFFNWEYMNWGLSRNSPYPFLGVYAPISNKAIDKIMYKMRSRYNTILINAYNFRNAFHTLKKDVYAIGLAADQNPPSPERSFWVDFFGRKTSFYMGPEKGAQLNNTAVIFTHYYRIKRGYYKADFSLYTTSPRELKRGELTVAYVKFLEECIRKTPSNYLWSHRRWKHEYKDAYQENLLA